jgi:TonB family protein
MTLAPGQRSDYYHMYIMNSWLDRYYDDVSILYDLGYAKENPGEYAEFKQDVIRWFARMHRRFTSWEKTKAHSPLPPIKAHRTCVMPDRPPSIANAAEAEYPDLERTVGMGYFIVTVAVIIGQAGNVLKTTVLQSSSNVLIDGAAIQAARKSTYAPEIRDCKPVTASYIFRADLSP